MVCNIVVTITGNRGTASAYLLVLISKDGNHPSLPLGRYACELIKEDRGQCRLSRRTVFHDHDYTLEGIVRYTRGASGGRSRPAPAPPVRSSKGHIPAYSTGMQVAKLERLWRRLEPISIGHMPLCGLRRRESRFGRR
jgi:hypothetical protein